MRVSAIPRLYFGTPLIEARRIAKSRKNGGNSLIAKGLAVVGGVALPLTTVQIFLAHIFRAGVEIADDNRQIV